MADLKVIPSENSLVTNKACETAKEFSELAADGEITGYVIVYLDREGAIHGRTSFIRRLELMGAIEMAKITLFDT